jgi:hypothetical protein
MPNKLDAAAEQLSRLRNVSNVVDLDSKAVEHTTAELLVADRLEDRIASVRRAVPDIDMVTNAYDMEGIVHMSTRDQLMKERSSRVDVVRSQGPAFNTSNGMHGTEMLTL